MKKTCEEEILTPDEAAAEWNEIKDQAARNEERLRFLGKILQPHLAKCPEEAEIFSGWQLSLSHVVDKESFRLKDAKEKIDGRVLAPYITKSSYTQILRSWKGK